MGDPPGNRARSQRWRHPWSLSSLARQGRYLVGPAVSERVHSDLCGHRNVAVVISRRRRTRHRGLTVGAMMRTVHKLGAVAAVAMTLMAAGCTSSD